MPEAAASAAEPGHDTAHVDHRDASDAELDVADRAAAVGLITAQLLPGGATRSDRTANQTAGTAKTSTAGPPQIGSADAEQHRRHRHSHHDMDEIGVAMAS